MNAIYEARMRATEDAARIARRDAEDAINEVVRLGNELHELKKDLQLFQKQVGADMNSLERRVR